MKKVLSLVVAVVLLTTGLFAQTASVQVIHNSPTPGTDAGPVVDIYVNGTLLPPLTAVPFRAATPYLSVTAGTDIEIAIAVSPSMSVADSIAAFDIGQLTDGESYTVIANGIVGDDDNPFGLAINTSSAVAANPGQVDVMVFHGSPGAPAVDVDARGVANELVDDLAYGQFTEYIGLDPATYLLDVRANDDPNIVGSFQAPLATGTGAAATVFASGILGGTPGFGLFTALPSGTVIPLPATSQAAVQVIHNSPTPGTDAGPVVDIYVNGALLPELTAVPFRAATEYLAVEGDVDINIGVAVNPSTVMDTIAAFDLGQLANGENYTIVANGIVGDDDNPFNLEVTTSRQTSADPSQVDVIVFHGSPDAPAVDVDARGVINELVDNLSFGEFTDYIGLPGGTFILDVRVNDDPNIVASFLAPLATGVGAAATVFASGLLGDTPGFGLFVALPDGTVIPLPQISQANVQVIHNSPTPGTDAGPVVDIYVNGALLPELTAVPFRAATEYLPVEGDVDIQIGVAVNPSTVMDTIAAFDLGQLANGENYTIIANGIVGDDDNPFNLEVTTSRQTSADPSQVDVIVFHGSPDAPAVDVDARNVINELVDDLSFGEFTEYVGLPGGTFILDVRVNDDPNIVASFLAPLATGVGSAATVFASGLLNDTPGFGLFVALPDGTVIPLPPISQAGVQVIHNSPSPGTEAGPIVDIYVNGALLPELTAVPFRAATEYLPVEGDVDINIGVAVNPSTIMDTIASFDLGQLANGQDYTIIANGIVGDDDTPFELAVTTSRRSAADSEEVDLLLFHGSPDAPEVDVILTGGGVLFDNVAYGEYSDDYLGVAPAVYDLSITPSEDNNTTVRRYEADITSLAGGSATIFASGLLTDGSTPEFGAWVALADGTTFPLSLISSTNELAEKVEDFALFPNPAQGYTNVSLNLKEAGTVLLRLIDQQGRVLKQFNYGQLPAGELQERLDLGNQPAGNYYLQLQMEEGQLTTPFLIQR